uniref:UBC core domain-containing protein n=1 Tax=Leersia perrieri TaxID=77586 RepID=A0A0D9VKC5_9ORYZ
MSSCSPPPTAPVPEPERIKEETRRELTLRLIRRDLRNLSRDPPPYCRPGREPVTDAFHWEVIIDGPAGTPYAGGTFPIDVKIPADYPLHPPKLAFKTKVYHPNIDEKGNLVVEVGDWTPCYKIDGILVSFVSLLYDPLLDRPINGVIAKQYEYEYERYEEEARAWTQEYSSTPIASHYPPNSVIGRTPPVVPHFPATAARRRAATAAAESSGSGSYESLWRRLEEDAGKRKRNNPLRRINRELDMFWRDPPPYCRPGPEPVTDPFHWDLVIDGPAGTPYAGGTFPIDISFPAHYPSCPPKITFKTKVYHPNIDEEGQIVLDILKKNWAASVTIQTLLRCVVSVLYDPLLDYPINEDIAFQYLYEYKKYEEEAKAWTEKYSSTAIASHYLPKTIKTPPVVPHFPATADRIKALASSASSSPNQKQLRQQKFVECESLWRKPWPCKVDGRRRLGKELCKFWLDPPPYCRPGASPVKDHLHFEVVIDGPAGTPYAGGTFPIDVQFPTNYPFRPPKLTFKTKVYHPNIDGKGRMALDIFQDRWSPAFTISSLLLSFVSILFDPLLDHPTNHYIAHQYKYKYEQYEKKAMAWTQKYSSKPIVSHYPLCAVMGMTPPVVPHFPATAARRKAAVSPAFDSVSSGGIPLRVKDVSIWRRTVRFVQRWSP